MEIFENSSKALSLFEPFCIIHLDFSILWIIIFSCQEQILFFVFSLSPYPLINYFNSCIHFYFFHFHKKDGKCSLVSILHTILSTFHLIMPSSDPRRPLINSCPQLVLSLLGLPWLPSYIVYLTSCIYHILYNVDCNTILYKSYHISYFTYHTLYVIYHISYILYAIYCISYIIYHTSCIIYHIS